MRRKIQVALSVVIFLILLITLFSCEGIKLDFSRYSSQESVNKKSVMGEYTSPAETTTVTISISPSVTQTPERKLSPTNTPLDLPSLTTMPSPTYVFQDIDIGVCISSKPETASTKYELPDIDALRWVNIEIGPYTLRHLDGLTTYIWNVDPSPDGRWILVELVREDREMSQGDTALYVVDIKGEEHWIASGVGPSQLQRHLWLTDGRLLWVDSGTLLIANGDGRTHRDLAAPEEMYEVWLGEKETALVDGKSGMWRVNYETGLWDRVKNAPRPGNLSVSLDGSYALAVTFDGKMLEYWYIPISKGEPARLLTQGLFAGGHCGRIRPPLPIPNGSLWFTGEWIYFEEKGFDDVGIINTYDGFLTPMREILDIPDIWTKYYEVSNDKGWMSLGSEYITSGEALNEGLFVEGEILGWEEDPVGVYLRVNHPEGVNRDEITSVSLEHVALPSGQRRVLIEGLDPSILPDVIGEGVVYSRAFDYLGSVLYALSMQGEILSSLRLPEVDYPPDLILVNSSDLVIEMAVRIMDSEGETLCMSEYLWLWELNP